MALGSTITQVTDSGLKPGITFPSFVSSGVATATNFKTGTTDVHSTGVTVATSVVGSAVTSNSTGIDVTGIVTATTFKGALTGTATQLETNATGANLTLTGNLGVGGTITYEDVARVDATGISTFREGFGVGPLAGIALTAYKDGSIRTTGIITASSFGSDTNSIFTTGGTERFRITSDGNLLIGTTSSATINSGDASLQVKSTTKAISILQSESNDGGANIDFAKSRGGAVVQSGDNIGNLFWNGHDGTDYATRAAAIQGWVDTTPGGNDMPGRITFSTTADGAASLTERMRINSSGHVGVNTDFTGSQTWRNGQRLEIFGGGGSVTGELHLGANRGDGTQSVGSINWFDNTQDSNHRQLALIEVDKSGSTSNKRGGDLIFYTKTDNVAAPNEKVRITSTGKLGVNTTAPVENVGIAGSMRFVTANGTRRMITALPSGNYATSTSGGSAIGFERIADGGGGSDEIYFETHWQGNRHGESMRINKKGYVTKPQTPSFRAYHNSTSDFTSGSTIIWGATESNNGNCYNTGTGHFTVPVTGYYWFAFTVKGQAVGNTVYCRAQRSTNGGSSWSGIGPALEFHNDILSAHTTASFGQQLNVDDKVRIASASNVRIDGSNGWSGFLVG